MLRAGVYQDEMSEEMKNRFSSGLSRFVPFLDPNGCCLPSLNSAILHVLDLLYAHMPLPEIPLTDKHISLLERNREICECYAAGETLEQIGRDMRFSYQRVYEYEIVRH